MVRPYTHHNGVHHNLIGPVHERRRVKTLHVLHARAHKNHWNPQLIVAVHDGLRAKFRSILLACDHRPYNISALIGLIDYYQAHPADAPTVYHPVSVSPGTVGRMTLEGCRGHLGTKLISAKGTNLAISGTKGQNSRKLSPGDKNVPWGQKCPLGTKGNCPRGHCVPWGQRKLSPGTFCPLGTKGHFRFQ